MIVLNNTEKLFFLTRPGFPLGKFIIIVNQNIDILRSEATHISKYTHEKNNYVKECRIPLLRNVKLS